MRLWRNWYTRTAQTRMPDGREGSTPSERTKESEPVRVLGVAANDCAVHRRGVRLARSPLVDGEPDRRAGFVWNANEGYPQRIVSAAILGTRTCRVAGAASKADGRTGGGGRDLLVPRRNFGKMRRRRGTGL